MKMKNELPPQKLEQIDDEALESFRNLVQLKGPKKAARNDSDDEVNVGSHRKLLSAIEKIDRTQHIKTPARTEVATKESEFHVVKSTGIIRNQEKFSFHKLKNVPKKSSASVAKDLKKLSRSKKKLAKPLEKPIAERISRGIAYEKARLGLDRWEAVVQKNRFDDCLVFPQKGAGDVTIEEDSHEKSSTVRVKSDLMLELEALEGPMDVETAPKSDVKLSKKELLAQQKELARLRRKESYEIEKARRQNKIKSKKYHKVMKKEKVRKELLEFESLQKSNPEEALRRLELLEKHRVAERSQLRHRNTGSWAKNLQIRAKYDKEARRDLAEQLSIGRELKQQKEQQQESEESEEDAEKDDDYDPFNPWQKKNEIVEEPQEGYRKYWKERNENEQKRKEYEALEIPGQQEKKKKRSCGLSWTVEDVAEEDLQLSTNCSLPKVSKKKSIDDIFDVADEKLDQKITNKIKEVIKMKGNSLQQEKKKKTKSNKNHLNLELKKNANRPEIDEALQESVERSKGDKAQELDNIKSVLSSKVPRDNGELNNIVPDNFATVEVKLRTALPDDEENEEEKLNGKLSLTEAFEDDDIFQDFSREKSDHITADQPQDIDLTLPGWGSWTGQGITKRPKRMVLKFPKNIPRKDSTKNSVIINEIMSDKTKEHLVRDLPYPFTSVRDFEASIRTPVGRTFVPETAHRVLTKPSIVTKMGTIIEPMDEQVLLNADKPQRPKTKTGRKIEKIFEK